MYVVREKDSKKIIHINPAPLSQALEGKDVYYRFDARRMQIGTTDGPLPELYDITADGKIVELSLEQKVAAGLVELGPEQKLEGGEIVEKSLSEKVRDGLVDVPPGHKLEGEQFVAKSADELLEEGRIDLAEVKRGKLEEFSRLSLMVRERILPTYKIQNALLGIYDEQTRNSYRGVIEAFRAEYRRLEALVDKADTLQELERIAPGFPGSLEDPALAKSTRRRRGSGEKKG